MGMPATTPQMTGPAEPVPVAFIGRTSTLTLQDPAASLRRQVRECQAKLPPGLVHRRVVLGHRIRRPAHRGTRPRQRARAVRRHRHPPRRRTGRPARRSRRPRAPVRRGDLRGHRTVRPRHLLRAASSRSSSRLAGIPLFATDEPIDVAGANATTVLVRRVKQGVAEWFRLQIKEKAWRGLREHSLAGWNIGTPPHGYAAERVPHPVPYKAAQGRTKTRLILDPDRAPAVARSSPGGPGPARRAHHRPAAGRRPAPLPAAPKAACGPRRPSTHPAQPQVHRPHGVRPHPQPPRRPDRRRPRRPMAMVTRTDPPRDHHPAVVGRRPGHRHRTLHQPRRHPGQRPPPDPPHLRAALPRPMPLLQTPHVRHHPHRHPLLGRGPDYSNTYYTCSHDPDDPRHTAPDGHPRTISVREDHLLPAIHQFFAQRVFGPDRATLLAADLPASAADDQARRDRRPPP